MPFVLLTVEDEALLRDMIRAHRARRAPGDSPGSIPGSPGQRGRRRNERHIREPVLVVLGEAFEEEADQQWSWRWTQAEWNHDDELVTMSDGLSSKDREGNEDEGRRAWNPLEVMTVEDHEMPPGDGAEACDAEITINEETYSLASTLLIRKPWKTGTPAWIMRVPRVLANGDRVQRWTIVSVGAIPRLCPYCPPSAPDPE
jgi:hypothetical protein